MKKITFCALAALATCAVGPSLAQQPAGPPVGPDWSKIEVKTIDLGNHTYMLEGFGGNVTVAAGDDGVIMVDGQFAPMHDKLKAAIEAVSSQPIRFLINTHYHRDHVGGNALFTKDGAVVVAHEKDDGHPPGQVHAGSGRDAARHHPQQRPVACRQRARRPAQTSRQCAYRR